MTEEIFRQFELVVLNKMDVERIRVLFDRFASEYDKRMLKTNHVNVQYKILDGFLPFLHGSVLDAATGTGTIAKYIRSKSSCKVYAIDNSPEMIVEANKNSQGIEYRVADAHRLPYGNETFDAVTICYGFYWFENPEKVITAVIRVLKPDGIFVVMEEEFKQGRIPKPKFSEKGGYLEELANLEQYIGIDRLQQKIEKRGFGLIR